jgi:CBS domain-containing protein
MTQFDPAAWVRLETGPLPMAASAAHRPPTAHRSMSVRQVAELLACEPGGAVVVDDPGHGVEVVSLRDIAGAISRGVDVDTCTIGALDLIRRPYVDAADDLYQVAARMVHQATDEALVFDQDGLVGMLSMRDICRVLSSKPSRTSRPDTAVGMAGTWNLEPDMEVWVDQDDQGTKVRARGRLDAATAVKLSDLVRVARTKRPGPLRVDLHEVFARSDAGVSALERLMTDGSV